MLTLFNTWRKEISLCYCLGKIPLNLIVLSFFSAESRTVMQLPERMLLGKCETLSYKSKRQQLWTVWSDLLKSALLSLAEACKPLQQGFKLHIWHCAVGNTACTTPLPGKPRWLRKHKIVSTPWPCWTIVCIGADSGSSEQHLRLCQQIRADIIQIYLRRLCLQPSTPCRALRKWGIWLWLLLCYNYLLKLKV